MEGGGTERQRAPVQLRGIAAHKRVFSVMSGMDLTARRHFMVREWMTAGGMLPLRDTPERLVGESR